MIALTASMLLDPTVLEDPYEFYATLRAQAPVWRVPDTDVVAISTFARETPGCRPARTR
jgi:cytochrome P450 family 144